MMLGSYYYAAVPILLRHYGKIMARQVCSAYGCPVFVDSFMCSPHTRLLSKEMKDALKAATYRGKTCIEAIEMVADREGKDIPVSEYARFMTRYEGE